MLTIYFEIQGRFCENRCQKGFYGINCASKCFCYNENECDPVTGNCHCIGFTGKHCENPCPDGTFGEEVTRCHPMNGTCICLEGFQGERCDEKICPFDRFGPNCENECACNRKNTKLCHPTIGFCSCHAGYTGAGCNSPCPTSYYGENCEKKCECNLNTGSQCDPVTGQCICAAGYQGIRYGLTVLLIFEYLIRFTCDEKCPEGLFGMNCESKCNCKNGASCDHRFGTCNCTAGRLLSFTILRLFELL
ncbi:unnamed protein product [Onchocerca flexuosa]|uniref:EGF-like domain protein n=1 Tax=Onchocerca flexuosa TaxID=387005 RepID=A0A183HI15_9BILA|nr:unnamed protein product [Onchocerca flexuosa]